MRISDWSSDVCSSDLFNVIPHIDKFLDDGSTKEEWKMVVETKKILDPKIKVTATCVRVSVFAGHSESVNVELDKALSAEQAQDILGEAPGVMPVAKRQASGYATPVVCVDRQSSGRGERWTLRGEDDGRTT